MLKFKKDDNNFTHLKMENEVRKLESLLHNSNVVPERAKESALETALICVYLYFNRSEGMASQSVYDFYFPKNSISVYTSDLDNIINYIDEIIATCPKSVKKVNLPIIFVVADMAIKNGMNKDVFTEKVKLFFSKGIYEFSEYREYTTHGTMKKERVQKRIELLSKLTK